MDHRVCPPLTANFCIGLYLGLQLEFPGLGLVKEVLKQTKATDAVLNASGGLYGRQEVCCSG